MNPENREDRTPMAPAGSTTAPVGLFAWLPWLVAVSFVLLAAFLLAAFLVLRAEVAALRDQAALAEVQGKVLQQQIDAERILSAHRLADLASDSAGPRDLSRLQIIPLTPPAGAASSPPSGIAVLDSERREGLLVAWALPAIATDRTYHLWLVDSENPAGASLAAFLPDPGADPVRIPFKLDHPAATGAHFRVSLERKGGVAAPEGPVVLTSH